ncbi:MAG TPA: hypothetical protein VFN10_20015 [Thermoanaerobaculia bacterium]|nr:hypothetical protein [Thermoanaerobaculia bacterium]
MKKVWSSDKQAAQTKRKQKKQTRALAKKKANKRPAKNAGEE